MEIRSLVEGGGTVLVLYRIVPGTEFVAHRHEFPEYGSFILGRGRLLVDGESRELSEGDSYYIPAGADHGFDSPLQPGPVVVLHVSVGREGDPDTGMFRELVKCTRSVARESLASDEEAAGTSTPRKPT